MNLLEETLAYVQAVFAQEYSGHDFYHTMRVYRTAAYLARQEQADVELVQLAALLHDVDDRKLSPQTCENKEKAVAFLRRHGVEEERIARIVTILKEVSFAGTDSVVPCTIEGQCVQDADRLDALGAIGIARTFAYGGHHNRKLYDPEDKPREHMTAKEYFSHESSSLNHFYEKLFLLESMMTTPTAKFAARKRTALMRDYVDAFLKEWDGLDFLE